MPQRDYPEYGPIQRRRGNARPQPMATPAKDEWYTGATVPMQTIRRHAPPPRRRSGRGWWWKAPLLLIFMLCGAAFAGLAWLDREYAGRIYPNVAVQGIDLSQKTLPEAEQLVKQQFEPFLARPITINYQGQTWQPTPEELGLTIDVKRDVMRAYNLGRGNGLIANLQQVATIYQQGQQLPLQITLDQPKLHAYLNTIAGEVQQAPREATLTIADNNVQVSDSVDGRIALIDETAQAIQAALPSLKPQTIAFQTSDLRPDVTTESIAEARRTVAAMLASPIQLKFKDTTFELDQATLADLINIQRVAGDAGTTFNAQLDQRRLEKWVTGVADEIGRESVEPRVNWNGGNLQIVREGRVGYRLDIPHAVEMINGAVTTTTRALDLPVEEVQPQVRPETLASLGIKEVVSTGRSDFTGSAAYRITNIKVGLQKINGILIPPDGEFSFNENVGPITQENGFVEGYAIIGNRTQLEPGGGICQDSTTLFRAAFYAGLPFEEWTPHRFRISWYEKYDPIGMDATIYQNGGPDLRFVNDTGNWLLIQAYANDADGSVTVALYGTKVPGRTVERTEPEITGQEPAPTAPVYVDDPEMPLGQIKQTDTARGGMKIEIIRTVKQDGQIVRQTPFRTSFAAWPNIFVKNPKTPKPAGGR